MQLKMGQDTGELWQVGKITGVVRRTQGGLLDSNGIVASEDNAYRYILWRVWNTELKNGICAWVMLNPSTADEIENDPTITKCSEFARRWGHDGIVVVNLFALRSTDPKELSEHQDPVGPFNPHFVVAVLDHDLVTRTVLAWGNEGALDARDESFCVLNATREMWCLQPPGKDALTKLGAPRHPVRLAYASQLRKVTWDGSLTVEGVECRD